MLDDITFGRGYSYKDSERERERSTKTVKESKNHASAGQTRENTSFTLESQVAGRYLALACQHTKNDDLKPTKGSNETLDRPQDFQESPRDSFDIEVTKQRVNAHFGSQPNNLERKGTNLPPRDGERGELTDFRRPCRGTKDVQRKKTSTG